jgi:hypothetical protein
MLKYSIRIDEGDFFNAANEELQKLVSSSISYAISKTRNSFKEEIRRSLVEDSFYSSLTDYDNVLFFQIGLPNVGSVADTIVDYVSKAFSLRKLPARKNDFGGFSIVVLKEGIQPLLSLPFASYASKGGDVNWLEWLLTSGTSEVVANYRIIYGDFRSSRTKEAIMIPSKSGGFKFDAEFAGTEDNNWITRSLKRLESRLTNIFENIINSYIQK